MLEHVGDYVVSLLRETIRLQGHTLTGKLEASIEYEVRQKTNGFVLDFYHENYGKPLNTGVPAARIPYSRGSGNKQSLYIQGLVLYVKKRMQISGDKEALGIAFAIAATHKKQGMPTQSSYKYSQTGKRTMWIEETLTKNESNIAAKIEVALFTILDNIVTNYIFN
jgi:hypothetical protein